MLSKACRGVSRHGGASLVALAAVVAAQSAVAQTITLPTIDISRSNETGITNDLAIGSKAPPGTAPALAPSQAKLSTSEPVSIVSDKVLRDVIKPNADYNEALKWTPGFTAGNPNGVGDTKGAWRGFAQGQYNVTFDGIPFGDLVDQHSANYFPAAFLGAITIDRAPGPASQPGYATFGGTLGLFSRDLTDRPGGDVSAYAGNFGTFTTDTTLQSGTLASGARFMLGFHHQNSDGTLDFGKQSGDFGIFKLEQPLGDFTLTALSTIGQEGINNVGFATFAQYQQNGKSYGALNGNPSLNTYYGYNNYVRQSDLEYIDLKGAVGGWRVDNKGYTYGIGYPEVGSAGANLKSDIANPIGTSIKVPSPSGASTTVPLVGVGANDVTGYKKYDDTRAYGDLLTVERDLHAGAASGTLRTGLWFQYVGYNRLQQYYDYSTGQYFSSLGNALNTSYKELFSASVYSFYPFIEYDWHPTSDWTITPGYKYESFSRQHLAVVNQTTLAMSDYNKLYTANLPFLTARYRVNENTSVYAQASEGMLAPNESAYYVFNTQANQVEPERTENYQTGLVYKSEKIAADADLYLINAQHFASQTTDSTGATFYRDNGGAQYKGVEAELTYALFNGLALYGNGTYGSGRFTSGEDANGNPHAGNAIGGTPRYTAAAGVIYDDGHAFGSVLCKIVGDSWGTQGSDQVANPMTGTAFTTNHVPAYESTDVVAGYRLPVTYLQGAPGSLEFRVGVNNLLDSRVVTDIQGVPLANYAASAGLQYEFQPARTIYAGLKARF